MMAVQQGHPVDLNTLAIDPREPSPNAVSHHCSAKLAIARCFLLGSRGRASWVRSASPPPPRPCMPSPGITTDHLGALRGSERIPAPHESTSISSLSRSFSNNRPLRQGAAAVSIRFPEHFAARSTTHSREFRPPSTSLKRGGIDRSPNPDGCWRRPRPSSMVSPARQQDSVNDPRILLFTAFKAALAALEEAVQSRWRNHWRFYLSTTRCWPRCAVTLARSSSRRHPPSRRRTTRASADRRHELACAKVGRPSGTDPPTHHR